MSPRLQEKSDIRDISVVAIVLIAVVAITAAVSNYVGAFSTSEPPNEISLDEFMEQIYDLSYKDHQQVRERLVGQEIVLDFGKPIEVTSLVNFEQVESELDNIEAELAETAAEDEGLTSTPRSGSVIDTLTNWFSSLLVPDAPVGGDFSSDADRETDIPADGDQAELSPLMSIGERIFVWIQSFISAIVGIFSGHTEAYAVTNITYKASLAELVDPAGKSTDSCSSVTSYAASKWRTKADRAKSVLESLQGRLESAQDRASQQERTVSRAQTAISREIEDRAVTELIETEGLTRAQALYVYRYPNKISGYEHRWDHVTQAVYEGDLGQQLTAAKIELADIQKKVDRLENRLGEVAPLAGLLESLASYAEYIAKYYADSGFVLTGIKNGGMVGTLILCGKNEASYDSGPRGHRRIGSSRFPRFNFGGVTWCDICPRCCTGPTGRPDVALPQDGYDPSIYIAPERTTT